MAGTNTVLAHRHAAWRISICAQLGDDGQQQVATTIEPTPYDQLFFDQFRIGTWPNYFDGVQFDRKPETLDQFFRSVTPNAGPYDAAVIADAMSALFARQRFAPCGACRHGSHIAVAWTGAWRHASKQSSQEDDPEHHAQRLAAVGKRSGRVFHRRCSDRHAL